MYASAAYVNKNAILCGGGNMNLGEPCRLKSFGWHIDYYVVVGISLALFKHFLVIQLPIEARHYELDDLLMVKMAEGLVQGQWLGDYSAATLMKGCFFPLFLALINKIGLSYLSTLDWLYCGACFFFVREMRHIIKHRASLLLLFVVLLFNPGSFSLTNFQRVYRSSLILIQVLCLFALYFGYYFYYRDYSVSAVESDQGNWRPILYAAGVGGVLWSVWNTREDTIWLLPFVITASLLIIREIFLLSKKLNQPSKYYLRHILISLIPCMILVSGNEIVAQLNDHNYGQHVRLECSDGNFAQAMKAIYSIKNKENVPYTTVSHEKLERLLSCSPSLALIRPELEHQMNYYDAIDRNGQDGEVEDGWFFWGLKKAAFQSGLTDTLPRSQAYWLQVAQELQLATQDPEADLEVQQIMPSALMSPWRQEYWKLLIPTTIHAVEYIASFEDAEPSVQPSNKANAETTRRFEIITNDFSLYSDGFSDSRNQAERSRYQPTYEVLMRIANIYKAVNKPILVASVCCYLFLLFWYAKERNKQLVPVLLIPLGMFLSMAALSAGTAYTEISAFHAIKCFYLAGAYPLMLAFEVVSLSCFFQAAAEQAHKRKIRSQ